MQDVSFYPGISSLESGRPVFLGTPFLETTAQLNQNGLWMRWGDYMVVDSYSDTVEELRAIRERVAMGDMTPLTKYRISGEDAETFLDRLVPRNISKLAVGQIYYAPWCSEEGDVLGDGLIIRESEHSFLTSSDPMLNWLQSNAAGHRVTFEDVTDAYGILTVQGPKSRQTIESAAEGGFDELSYSRLGNVRIAGRDISIIRQGFTGEHGYELWVEREHGPAVWAAIEEAGNEFGILPAGSWALDIARIEAGLLIVGYDYTNVGPDEGAAAVFASRERNASPYDLDLGRLIDFESLNFIGGFALKRISEARSHRRLLGVEIDWKPLEDEQPGNLRRVKWYPVNANKNSKHVGFVTSITWSPTTGKLIGFGHFEPGAVDVGEKVNLAWANNGRTISVSANVRSLPFYKHKRSATTNG
jgi:aminomethyltransferase